MIKVELAVYEIGGSWAFLAEYDSVDEAKAAAIEWAKNGTVDQTDDGVCHFGITSESNVGHYEEEFHVEYETGESW